MLDLHLGAELLHALDVEIDRTGTPRAAPGERDPRFAEPREQRTQDVDRRAHRLDQLVGSLGVSRVRGIHEEPVIVVALAPDAEER